MRASRVCDFIPEICGGHVGISRRGRRVFKASKEVGGRASSQIGEGFEIRSGHSFNPRKVSVEVLAVRVA